MTKKKLTTNPVCHAHKKTGEQCRKLALHGMTVCRSHGGASPSSREKARERILAAADPAVTTVIEIMFDHRHAAPVRLAAARDLLDRADPRGRSVLEVDVEVDPALLVMIAEARDEARRALPAGAELARDGMDDVIDAELTDDDDPDDGGYAVTEFEPLEI